MSAQKSGTERFAEALGADVFPAFKNLASEIMKEGSLSAKDKQLIALACSVAVRCEECVRVHKVRAQIAGASPEEMLEAAAVGGLVRMGSGFNTASALLDE